jgi:hypothetical protein
MQKDEDHQEVFAVCDMSIYRGGGHEDLCKK